MNSFKPTLPEPPTTNSNKKWIIIAIVVIATLSVVQFVVNSFILNPLSFLQYEEGVDIDIASNGMVTYEADDGVKISSSDVDNPLALPSDWPEFIPVANDAKLTQTASAPSGPTGKEFLVTYVTQKSVADVILYYKQELQNFGWKPEYEYASVDSGTVISFTEGTKDTVVINISKEAKGTLVRISVYIIE